MPEEFENVTNVSYIWSMKDNKYEIKIDHFFETIEGEGLSSNIRFVDMIVIKKHINRIISVDNVTAIDTILNIKCRIDENYIRGKKQTILKCE